MGNKIGTFIGIDQTLSLVQSTDSHKIKQYHVLNLIAVTVSEWKSRQFS